MKKILYLLIVFFLYGCSNSNNNDNTINLKPINGINRINGNFLALIEIKEWKFKLINQTFLCEDFKLQESIKKIHDLETEKLLKKIFQNITVSQKESLKKDFDARLSIKYNKLNVEILLKNNEAILKIDINSLLEIKNNNEITFKSSVNAKGSGKKVFLLNCSIDQMIIDTVSRTIEDYLIVLRDKLYEGISYVEKKN